MAGFSLSTWPEKSLNSIRADYSPSGAEMAGTGRRPDRRGAVFPVTGKRIGKPGLTRSAGLVGMPAGVTLSQVKGWA